MVDCFSFSLLLGSNHPSFWFVSDTFANFRFHLIKPQVSTIIFHGLIHCSCLLPPRGKHHLSCSLINVKGVTSLGRHTRPACQPGSRFVFSLNHKKMIFHSTTVCFSWLLGCEGSGATFHGLRLRRRSTRRSFCTPGSPLNKTMWKMWI